MLTEAERNQLLTRLRAADALMPQIVHALGQCRLFEPPLSYRGRVKNIHTAEEKITRKRVTKPRYAVADLTDLIGLRFVTMLRLEIADVVSSLFRIVTGSDEAVPRGSFMVSKVTEFKQFVSGSAMINPGETGAADPLFEKLAELAEIYFPGEQRVRPSYEVRAQYSSVHLIIEFDVDVDGESMSLPVEFQIRSVFEEAWAEIDHMLFYEADREGSLVGRQERLAASRHLHILKSLLDTASEYAALIAEGNLGAPKDAAPNIMASLDGADYAAEVSAPILVHRDLIEAFTDLVRVKEALDQEAHRDKSQNAPPKLAAYASLADQFQDLAPRFHSAVTHAELRGKQGERLKTVMYLLAMEEALCRLLSGAPPQILKAAAIYRFVSEEFPERPTCLFRLGQTYRQLIESAEGIEEVNNYGRESVRAYTDARTLLDATAVGRELIISRGQRAYLDQNMERLLGFALWRTVDLRRRFRGHAEEDDYSDMMRAWNVARKALESDRISGLERLALLNSSTYFLLDALEIGRELGRGDWPVGDRSTLKALVDQLSAACKTEKIDTIPYLHTIFKGYKVLEERPLELEAARDVMRACTHTNLKDASAYDREIHERANREAWAVIDSADAGGR